MKKALVLENVDRTDAEISAYLNEGKYDVKVITNLARVSHNEIIMQMVDADILAIQSTFDNYTQFSQLLNLIPVVNEMKEKPIEIHVLYTYKHFENFLNIGVQETEKSKIIALLNQGTKIFDIKHETFEDADKGKLFETSSYFRKLFYKFDAVELFYNKERKIIWHIRRPVIKIYPDDYYQPIKIEPSNRLSKRIASLSQKELHDFYLLLSEDYQQELDLKEDLETPGSWANESGDYEELMELRNSRLALLDKLGIQSYK